MVGTGQQSGETYLDFITSDPGLGVGINEINMDRHGPLDSIVVLKVDKDRATKANSLRRTYHLWALGEKGQIVNKKTENF